MVKDIVFSSTEHVFTEIEAMNVRGGSPFGRAAAWAYKLALEREPLTTFEDLHARFQVISYRLAELKPTMATIHNTSGLINDLIAFSKDQDLRILKSKVNLICDNIINSSVTSVEKLSSFGADLISNNSTVLMHSYSSSLMGIFTQAVRKGKKFDVVCTESRPLRESRVAIKSLLEINIPVTLVTDAAMYEVLAQVDMVIVGADTISWVGEVANKVGTRLIALAASSLQIPVYVASEAFKIDKRTQFGHPIELEFRDKSEVLKNTEFENYPTLNVINQFFDITPPNLITGIITEYGLVSPHLVSLCWEKLENHLLKEM